MMQSRTGLWRLLPFLLLTGCVAAEVEPDFDMGGMRVVVLPFHDREVNLYPSEISVLLSRSVAKDIIDNNLDDIDVVPPGAVEQWFESRDIREMSVQEIGVKLGIRYVIHGEIYSFDTEGDIIGMESGLFRGKVEVHDVEKDRTVFERRVEVSYPKTPRTGLSEHAIRVGLLKRTGYKIGRKFYHHEPVEESWEVR